MAKHPEEMIDERLQTYRTEGRLWLRNAVSLPEIDRLMTLMFDATRPGSRIALNDQSKALLNSLSVMKDITRIWPGMRPVRVVGFGKSTDQNWAVPWHQDRVISVAHRSVVPGFENWSRKSGIWHCEPPETVLKDMLFTRIHIDPNTRANGAMQIARGSHAEGLIPASEADHIAQNYPTEVTEASPGDVLILPMLTLHRSGSSKDNAPRRAIRIDFASCALPSPLDWSS